MEVKELVKNLEVINDINVLSQEELNDKYASSEERFNSFINRYGDYFINHGLYQLRASGEYNKIINLINEGSNKYSNDNIFAYKTSILHFINYNKQRFNIKDNSLSDDVLESQYLFLESLGATKATGNNSYPEIVTSLYDSAVAYNNKGDYDIDDFFNYVNYIMNTTTSVQEFKKLVNRYTVSHPLIEKCNDVSFLYFANYMLTSKNDEVDDSFIHDVKSVINASKVMEHIGLVEKEYNPKTYDKVSKLTNKKIKKYYKDQEKKESGIRKLRKKINNR